MSGKPGPESRAPAFRAFLAACLLLPALLGSAEAPTRGAEDSPPSLEAKEAERLFLSYIRDPQNLIRNCRFLGGVRIDEISGAGDVATARIRYRIECLEEEIPMPSLTRTLLEIFVFRQREGHWEILGRAAELPPAARAGGGSGAQPRRFSAPDPLGPDRRAIAEKILLWAVSGRAPDGIKRPFPGGNAVAGESQVLLSDESLGGVEEVSVPGARVVILSPGALLERTVLESGGVWVRFESLEFEGDAATARVALVAPVLPPPRPGEEPTRVVARMEAHFARSGEAWVLTRFRPLN